MTVDLATLLLVAPFSDDKRQTLLANLNRLSNDQKLRLSNTAWFALSETYKVRLEYEREMLVLKISEGEKKFAKRDFDEIEEKTTQKFIQHLNDNSPAGEESIKEVVGELRERLRSSSTDETTAVEHSYAQVVDLDCPKCGQALSAQIWLIVDIVEQPRAVERILDTTLHVILCPNCKGSGQIDAPLLLYCPDSVPHLIVSPAQQTTTEEDRREIVRLLALLCERLRDSWCDEWAQEIPIVPRGMLPLAIAAVAAIGREESTFVSPEFNEALACAVETTEGLETNRSSEAFDRAIAAWHTLLTNPMLGQHPELHSAILAQSGTLYLHHYRALGQVDDLTQAIRAFEQAVESTPPDLPRLPGLLGNLGIGLKYRYERTGELSDLERAIQAWERAVESTPPDSPDLVVLLNNLGGGLITRYGLTGQLVDLEQAIRTWERAVDSTPPDSPHLSMCIANLGAGLKYRYERTGQAIDLEQAIRAFEQAVESTPPDSPSLPMYLNNLGAGLHARYEHTRKLSDLVRTIQAWERAVDSTPPGSPNLPVCLNNLGSGLEKRYERTGQLADLEQAIRACEQAVELTLPDSPSLPSRLNGLGGKLIARYRHTGQKNDLDQAIRAFEQAVARTPPDSLDLPGRLGNLGNAVGYRYEHTDQLADLEQAILACQQALDSTPPDSPDFPARLVNLSIALRDQYLHTGESDHLEKMIRVYKETILALDHAYLLFPVAYQLGQQAQLAVFYAGAVETHRRTGQLAQALAIAEGSKSRLFTSLLCRGQIPAPSVLPQFLVEQEQALAAKLAALDATALARHDLTVPALLHRAQTPALPALSQYLVEELTSVAKLVASDGTALARHGPAVSATEGIEPLLTQAQHRQILLTRLMTLWEQMESCGTEAADYVALRRGDRPSYEELTQLAADLGPETALVSLFYTGSHTLLFTLREGWSAPLVVEVPSQNLVWQELGRRFLREVHGFDGTGRRGETWHLALLPPLEELALQLDGVHRVVLAPELVGDLLPWGRLALEVGWKAAVVIAPTLGLLERVRRRSSGLGTGALVVGNPVGDLPYSEREAQDVAAMLGVEPLIGQEATKEAVLTRLENIELAHFATHADFNLNSPMDSGIILADGVLTAREILEQGLRVPDFLVLSACNTGMSGVLGGSEMAGLSQALLYAGARSLLVSLWAVNDPSTAHLMTSFYLRWREEEQDKATALRGAMEATRRARSEWEHTYYWGAFNLVGDWR